MWGGHFGKKSTNLTIKEIKRDDVSDNLILISTKAGDCNYTFGSVYGPNHDHESSFYTTLTNTFISMGNNNVILGGDWNATWDNSRVGKNLDVINMADIPSYIRSNSMADTLKLTDPYRIFYPNKRDFTFMPTAMQQRNRSRLDFFLVSKTLSNSLANCTIPNSTNGAIFDHKQIFLGFRRGKKLTNEVLRDHIFVEEESNIYVRVSVFKCCNLLHATITENLTEIRREHELRKLGSILSKLKIVRDLEISFAELGRDDRLEMRIEGIKAEIRDEYANIPDINFFISLNLSCSPDFFFEMLIMGIKNNSLTYQAHVYKWRKAKIQKLNDEIKELKKDFRINVNQLLEMEHELAAVIEKDLKRELAQLKTFDRLNNEKVTPPL